jgi:iron complex outermembrane recepter protein
MSRWMLLSSVAALAATPVLAAPGDTDVSEVVVTAAPYAISLDSATTSVAILDRGELDLAPSGGLGEALAGMVGVRSSFFGPGATRPVIRGLSGPRVLVLSNGMGQVDASALSPDHAVASDPQEAERIEVLRGPSALAYGGSAIGGVVNIIDQRIPTQAVEGLSGRAHGSAGSVDKGRELGGALKAGTGPLVFTLDGLWRESEDYEVPTFPESRRQLAAEGEPFPGKIASEVETTFTRLKAFGAGVGHVGDNGRIGISVRRTLSDYGVPGHAHEEDHSPAPGAPVEEEEVVTIDLEQTRYDLRGEYRLALGPFETVRFSAGYADYTHVELEGDEVGTRFLSDGWEGRLELIQAEREGWQGAVGLQLLQRDFDAQGDEAFVPPTETKEVGVFTLQRLDRESWGIEGGLRLERKSLDSTVGSRDFTGVSASLGGFLRPAQGWFVSLSGSRAERAPAQEELFADGPHAATRAFEVGDATLDSEVSWSADLTAHFSTDTLDVDAHAFVVRYDGFIDLRPTGAEEDDLPVFAFLQTDATFHGFEIEASLAAWTDGARTLRLEAGADYVRGKSDLGPPARIPPWSLTGRAILEDAAWSISAEVRRIGDQNRIAPFELATDGYTVLNAQVSVRPFASREFRIFLDGRNLGNVEAREHVSFLKDLAPLPGRNVRAGFSYRF